MLGSYRHPPAGLPAGSSEYSNARLAGAMGGDDWSFLDEEVARLERKGGKGGNGGGGGGAAAAAEEEEEARGRTKGATSALSAQTPFDEWSALDAELARIEGKGRSGRGETPTRETHRRDAPPPAPSHPSRQQREQRGIGAA